MTLFWGVVYTLPLYNGDYSEYVIVPFNDVIIGVVHELGKISRVRTIYLLYPDLLC